MSCLIKKLKPGLTTLGCKQKTFWFLGLLLVVVAEASFAQPQAAGSAEVLISVPGQTVMAAEWSPDGKTIAFSTDKYNGIWLADADGSNVRILTTDQGVGFGFSWSPDGMFILGRSVVTENRRRLQQIKIYNVRNSSYEILVDKTRGINSLPVWSSTGKEVVFVKGGQPETATSNQLKRIGRVVPRPVLYTHLDKIFLFDEATKSSREITSFEGRILFNFSSSPEGNKISFQVQGLGLYVMNTDGSELKKLYKGEKAAWLPGEKWIIVSVSEDDGYNITGAELYAVDIKTAEYFPLTENVPQTALKPTVSPDGKYVLFDNPDDGKIYRLELK
jgi:Tol biopolymer transport system component